MMKNLALNINREDFTRLWMLACAGRLVSARVCASSEDPGPEEKGEDGGVGNVSAFSSYFSALFFCLLTSQLDVEGIMCVSLLSG